MNDSKINYILVGVVTLVMGLLIGFSFSKTEYIQNQAVGSAVGTTFNTAKVAQININPTDSATTTAILNTDDSTRWVISGFAGCTSVGTSKTALTGTGLASLTLKAATSSTATADTGVNTNNPISLTIATTTPDLWINTVSSGTTNSFKNIWPSGTYMQFFFNATNTANCTVGAYYFGS